MAVQTVAVVGAGFMGSGIAQVCAQAGHTVRLIDADAAQIDKARKSIEWSVGRFVSKGVIEGSVESILGRVAFGTSFDAAREADFVIEAVYEDAGVKKSVWSKLDGICGAQTILGSNTSTIPISLLAAATTRPGQFVGIHFFGPVPMMRLVEVIRGQKTTDDTLNATVAFARGLGKNPIVVNKDVPGFLMNRIFGAMGCEAIRLVEAGVGRVEDIDQGMVDGFNFRMGPLSIADLSGLDIAYNAFRVMHEMDPEIMPAPPKLLERLVQEGKLGVKTGEGFYKYDAAGKKIGPAF
ncbi:MAG: 3-hydroxyacyl-CoA dehydrogenase family protein [Candidatus Hydrogenedentes bacterium]|nr:3-hydroxyacyl-CoA dehydrogenase family protein [Candidatus Hydrogenedentota bacterium]